MPSAVAEALPIADLRDKRSNFGETVACDDEIDINIASQHESMRHRNGT